MISSVVVEIFDATRRGVTVLWLTDVGTREFGARTRLAAQEASEHHHYG